MLSLSQNEDWLSAGGIDCRQDTTGYSFEMPVRGDAVTERLARRVEETVGFANLRGQTMRFRHYRPGESHPAHTDTYEIDGVWLLATALICLSDVEEGGETSFPRAEPEPIVVAPRKNRLILWFNHRPDRTIDESSWHEGRPVLRGSKATLTSFIYQV